MERICSKSSDSAVVFLLIVILSLISPKAFPEESNPADTAMLSSGTLPSGNHDTITQFNQFGSFGLFINGIRATIKSRTYNVMTNYSYRNFDGYRAHSSDYYHTFDLELGTAPSANTSLQIVGHYINGQVKQPGSLTKSEFGSVPFNADPRAVNRDENRITKKGQVDINYIAKFGKSLNHRIEISGNGTIEYFERVTKEFKITTRYIMGLTARYIYTCRIWHRNSEFSVGGNLFHQPERKEEYENWGGQKSDNLEQIEVEKTSISGCYISENFELVEKKLFVLLTGRYNYVIYSVAEETLPSRSDKKRYNAFIPEVALNYTVIPGINLFTSYEMDYRTPTDKELESPDPAFLYNEDLRPQTSNTMKIGINGALTKKDPALFFKSLDFEANVFWSKIDDEIVQFEIYGDYYYRNASITNRFGFALQSKLEIYQNLSFSIAYNFSDYIYKSYMASQWEEDSTGTLVHVKDTTDFSGNVEPNIPRNNLNLTLAYRRPIGGKTSVIAQVSYLCISGLWVDDANSNKTDVYNLVNAMLGLNMKFGRFIFTVSGGVNNIFNQIYVGNTNTNSADKRFYNAGSPRDFFGSVNVGYVF